MLRELNQVKSVTFRGLKKLGKPLKIWACNAKLTQHMEWKGVGVPDVCREIRQFWG